MTYHIFVFGSNLSGFHGRGSALEAYRFHGADMGIGLGRFGDSYAIPTKGYKLEVLPLEQIAGYVYGFLQYARLHQDLQFDVVEIGCGLAGYTPRQIAPLFRGHGPNVRLTERFQAILRG